MRRSADRIVCALCVLTVVSISACATVDPRPDFLKARAEIRSTTGEQTVFDPEGPPLCADEIQAMLSDGLGCDEAARLALLNNRRLQAGFMALGIGRSDYVQAGLLKNPSFSLAFLFPAGGGRTRWTADLAGSISELWQIPARKAVAEAGLEQSILDLSRFAGELVTATRRAYFESVAARDGHAVARANEELARRSLQAVRRQVEGGVATKVDENLAESLAMSAELALKRAGREDAGAKRELAALLSLETDLFDVVLTEPLPEPAVPVLEREALVKRSLESRPDVRAAAHAVAAAQAQVVLEKRRVFPEVVVGVSAERPETGSAVDFLAGPAAALEIPIFDQNQAQVSRAEYRLAELRREYEALTAEVSQAVRAAVDKAAIAAGAGAFAQTELIPQAERSAALAQKAYELGDTTLLSYLVAQKTALEARRTGIEAVLEAARSRIEVERTVGVPLDAPRNADARP
jgi:cobalt-zinc-cadmium efflux system outer membrane protein